MLKEIVQRELRLLQDAQRNSESDAVNDDAELDDYDYDDVMVRQSDDFVTPDYENGDDYEEYDGTGAVIHFHKKIHYSYRDLVA